MTIIIKYHEEFKNETISAYTHFWSYYFGDIASESSNKEYSLYSAGPNPPTVGVKYAIQSASPLSKAAIVMESKGMHGAMIMEDHGIRVASISPLIPGEVEILQFGEYLIPIPDDALELPQFHQLQLQQVQLEIRGLTISDDIDVSMIEVFIAMLIKNDSSDVNLGVYNLLRDNATPMLEILQSQGIDINTPLKDLAIASQFDIITDAPVIEAVGTTEEGNILIAA